MKLLRPGHGPATDRAPAFDARGDGMSGAPVEIAAQVVRRRAEHGRNQLPWQNTRDAYRVWLSEIMLQQTQVVTVLVLRALSGALSRCSSAGGRAAGRGAGAVEWPGLLQPRATCTARADRGRRAWRRVSAHGS